MKAKSTLKLPETMIEDAKRVDLVDLVGRYTTLHRESAREWSGACPKCAGRDRLHVNADGWFTCRQCHPERADSIGFMRWVHGLSFVDAVLRLTNGSLPARPQQAPHPAPQTPKAPPGWQDATWQRRAQGIATDAHERLCWLDAGAPGRDYLTGRGLNRPIWYAYSLGFRPDAPIPGTEGQRRAPALVIPWQGRDGTVYALRYRFLTPQDGHKMTSEKGSDFRDRLFGGHLLTEPANGYRTAVVCEGELNAMSIAQVFPCIDVLSIGSQSASIPPAALEYIGRYGHVILWVDEPAQARRLLSALPSAHAIAPAQDANDMLQAGTLGAFLAAVRYEACKGNQAAIRRLVYKLLDETADVGAQNIARQLEAFLISGQ